jgi:hypothetical protein
MSTECLRELGLLAPCRFSRVDIERESGGVLAKTLGSRAGVSLAFGLSALSEPDPLDEGLSAFSALSAVEDFFRALGSFSALGLDADFFGSLVGVAVHIPHEEEPSRLTLGRSFLDERTAAGVMAGGASGTAGGGGGTGGGGGGTSTISGGAEAFLDFLLFFGGDMSTIWTISSS